MKNGLGKMSLFLVLLVGLFAVEASAAGRADHELRSEVCLNGTWQLNVGGMDQFTEVRVPGSFSGQTRLWGREHWDVWGYPTAWHGQAAVYRRTIQVPEVPAGQRVLIHFGGVRHMVTVQINGEEVGTWSDSYVPFAFDITDQIHAGENELRVEVGPEETCGLFEDYNTRRRGIYQDVFLKFVPDVRVTPDLFVQTAVSRNELKVEVPVRNDSANAQTFGLRFKVTDADGKLVKSWADDAKVSVAPGAVKTLTVSESWKNPHLWSIDDPHLHHLTTEVVTAKGKVLDRHRQRFGFREITWENQHLYLNGREVFLRGHGGHPQGDLQHTKAYAEAWIRQLKEQGCDLMRLHDFPRNDELYDAADEMGFLFLSEAAHHFRLPPKEIQLAHVEKMVKRLRNHPSILMWSVANELHWRNFPEPVHLIELCRQLDPTRPAFNSDFSAWSVHGDVQAHHYDAANIWKDWEKHGPDKVMVWDEIGNVWQQDRPLKNGPAGFEISSQDVQTGTWRDGWEQLRNDIQIFSDGKEFNDRFYRVNIYVPWELSYSFYRFQPFNNFQRLNLEYDRVEGAKGMKPQYINPCATTINTWDPTLPENQPNPALYCFNEYLQRVRFPDDPKERTLFSGEPIERNGRLFFEDYRPADQVEFLVETPKGEVLTSVKRAVELKAGEYMPEFKSEWKLPQVDDVTPVRLVRQFSWKGNVNYRKVDEAKVFPRFKPVDLKDRKIAVVGERLQKLFKGAGVPVSAAQLIIAESFDPAWEKQVAAGVCVLVQPADGNAEVSRMPDSYSLAVAGTSGGHKKAFSKYVLSDQTRLSVGTTGTGSININPVKTSFQHPLPGTWLALDFDGSVNFSEVGTVSLDYTLWMHPGSIGYKKHYEKMGGAPFFLKKVRLLLRDAAGQWFVCGTDGAQALERPGASPRGTAVSFNVANMTWEPVVLANSGMQVAQKAVAPDFSTVSAVGLVIDESNPGSELQIAGFGLRGGAHPSAIVQPGAAQHQLLAGLGQEDFSFWRGGSSARMLPLPEKRNVRRILFGTKDGGGSALQESFIGRGVVLESALNLNMEEPAAGFVVNRMVDYLSEYKPASASGIVAKGALGEWLESMGADVAEEGRVVAVDAGQLTESKQKIFQCLENGGTVLFSEVTDETIGLVREITGQPLRLTEPYFGQLYKCIKAPVSWARIGTPHEWVDYYDGILVPYPFEPNFSPLLAGIANFDLDWNRTPMFKRGIEIEGMNPVSASADHQVLISNWHIGGEPTAGLYGEQLNGVRDLRQNSWFVNRDAVVMELAVGKGRVLISQLDLKAGGDKAQRVMQTLLTNLGVSFGGAMPPPAETIYDSKLRNDQLARFAVYDTQIASVQRQYYGVPKPMPDYLKATRIMAADDEAELPLMGFFGDPLTLGLNGELKEALADVVRIDKPVTLHRSRSAAGALKNQIGDKKYARVVFALGEADVGENTTDAEYLRHLEAVWKVLAKHSQKIYWMPVPSAFGKDEHRAVRAKELNRIAETFFEGKDVYKIPFVYADIDQLPPGYLSGDSEQFSPAEANALAKRLAEAVISFGAQ